MNFKIKKGPVPPSSVGRPGKYPWNAMAVGTFIEVKTPNGGAAAGAGNAWSRRNKNGRRVFVSRKLSKGVVGVWRIK